MHFIGDFHIHSSYSRATSKDLIPENLDYTARCKGISVIGTGDFTHPGWIADLEEKLQPAEEGLFTLKDEFYIKTQNEFASDNIKPSEDTKTRFLLTAEISSIYKAGDRVRKVHNVIFAPNFAAVHRIQKKIEILGGNIRSDGRPILGLDSRDLLELCLEADERILFVPAHIWTPWFSVLGSKSGFDSIEECFRDLSGHIHALETGLSSDPPMNWACSFLDDYTLISNSDAHSTAKLGREANLFDTGLSYPEITEAISGGAAAGFRGTIEFFPQEGKYHFDGHRKCNVCWTPLETLQHNDVCPVCGRKVTIGVLNRVAQLADRTDVHGDSSKSNRLPFFSLIPLKEILGELERCGSESKKVQARYEECLSHLGPELNILLNIAIDDIARTEGADLAEAIRRMRSRQVEVTAGYDGEYGHISVKNLHIPLPTDDTGPSLFTAADSSENSDEITRKRHDTRDSAIDIPTLPLIDFDLAEYREEKKKAEKISQEAVSQTISPTINTMPNKAINTEMNTEQEAAVSCSDSHSLIIAGPGTGKTRTVVEKIVRLVSSGAAPEKIFAITFANKAAGELRERLTAAGFESENTLDEEKKNTGKIRVFTFHSLGLALLKPHITTLGRNIGFFIIDDIEKDALLASQTQLPIRERKALIRYASRVKNGIQPIPQENSEDQETQIQYEKFRLYQNILKKNNAFDYDDLVYLPVRLFEKVPKFLTEYAQRIRYLIVDEYQDINPIQYTLLRLISTEAVVCAVGDPNQSIYGFRGGSPEFIRRFPNDFSGTRIFSLSQSYRCPDTVLRASGQILGNNENLLSGRRVGVKIHIVKTASAASEAEGIARDIETKTGGMGFFSFDSGVTDVGIDPNIKKGRNSGRKHREEASIKMQNAGRTQEPEDIEEETALSDIAILCRTSMQMPTIEKAFRDHRIPFRTVHTESIFDTEPYRSFLNFVRYILLKEQQKRQKMDVVDSSEMNSRKINQERLYFPGEIRNINKKELRLLSLPATRRETIELFCSLAVWDKENARKDVTVPTESSGPEKCTDSIQVDDLEDEIRLYWPDNSDGQNFVERARLASGGDRYDSRMQTVTLMTIHASKGLEFDTVYIPGCEDGLLPYSISGDGIDIEEERRLLYVAMTRAKRQLTISCAGVRSIFGKTRKQQESPFLSAIEKALLDRRELETVHKSKKTDTQLSLFD